MRLGGDSKSVCQHTVDVEVSGTGESPGECDVVPVTVVQVCGFEWEAGARIVAEAARGEGEVIEALGSVENDSVRPPCAACSAAAEFLWDKNTRVMRLERSDYIQTTNSDKQDTISQVLCPAFRNKLYRLQVNYARQDDL